MAFLHSDAVIEKVRSKKGVPADAKISVTSTLNHSIDTEVVDCYVVEINGVKHIFANTDEGILMEANEFWHLYGDNCRGIPLDLD